MWVAIVVLTGFSSREEAAAFLRECGVDPEVTPFALVEVPDHEEDLSETPLS